MTTSIHGPPPLSCCAAAKPKHERMPLVGRRAPECAQSKRDSWLSSCGFPHLLHAPPHLSPAWRWGRKSQAFWMGTVVQSSLLSPWSGIPQHKMPRGWGPFPTSCEGHQLRLSRPCGIAEMGHLNLG